MAKKLNFVVKHVGGGVPLLSLSIKLVCVGSQWEWRWVGKGGREGVGGWGWGVRGPGGRGGWRWMEKSLLHAMNHTFLIAMKAVRHHLVSAPT